MSSEIETRRRGGPAFPPLVTDGEPPICDATAGNLSYSFCR